MPISYTFIMIRSVGEKFPPEYSRQESDSEDTLCETDVAQWQLQSVTNPVISATASATQHSSGCISVCPASFTHVTDPHSTEVTSLSHISL